jgi:hypothetical protein
MRRRLSDVPVATGVLAESAEYAALFDLFRLNGRA